MCIDCHPAFKLCSRVLSPSRCYHTQTDTMDGVLFESEHPKKRRRRPYKERPLSARLVLDDSLRGNVGIISEDLWSALRPREYDDYGMVLME